MNARAMKSIEEIGKTWRFCGDGIFGPEYIEIDEYATNFRPSTSIFAKIHLDAKSRLYIWYKHHTYYISKMLI